MNINIGQYISHIDEQKLQMQELLHNGVVSIILPATPSKEITAKQENKPNKRKTYMLAGGVGIGVVSCGLMIDDGSLKWLLVGVGVSSILYGAYTYMKEPSKTQKTIHANSQIDYIGLASRINRSLAKVNASVMNAWDVFISEQKGKLKNEILASDADIDTKGSMMDAATSTSIIDISMSTFSMKINAAANKGDINEFRTILADYETAMKQAIVTACEEQKSKWLKISK